MQRSSAIDRLSVAAQQYCSWAEAEPRDPSEELRTALRLLSETYAAAVEIPEAKPGNGDDDFVLPLDAWEKVFRRFASLPIDYYAEVFDPSAVPAEEPVVANIADDLADVYRDLVQGVRLEKAGRLDDAVWQWQMNFRVHWGRHAVTALRALHCKAESNHAW